MKDPIVFEMETADPDDFLTLCWLADHPTLDLVGVLVTPGGEDQCRAVQWALDTCERPFIPIGTVHGEEWWKTDDGKKQRVSDWHYKVFGDELKTYVPGHTLPGHELLAIRIRNFPGLTVVTGAAPKTMGQWLKNHPEQTLKRWVMQGCFAGDNLVKPEHRLAKFEGRLTCPSYNPGGAPQAVLDLLAAGPERIEQRLFVSKNVCHGVRWNADMAGRFAKLIGEDDGGAIVQTGSLAGVPQFSTERPVVTRVGLRTGLRLMLQGLRGYEVNRGGPDVIPWEMESEKAGQGKAVHDLVAAAVCVDAQVCGFEEVEIYRQKGEWGAKRCPNTRTWISVAYDRDRFIRTLAQ
jgi:pyrimidine-specific ribonucleoside hydrolase